MTVTVAKISLGKSSNAVSMSLNLSNVSEFLWVEFSRTVFKVFRKDKKWLSGVRILQKMWNQAVHIVFDWARNKCPLSALSGVRIKRVEFRENVKAFPRDKANCP